MLASDSTRRVASGSNGAAVKRLSFARPVFATTEAARSDGDMPTPWLLDLLEIIRSQSDAGGGTPVDQEAQPQGSAQAARAQPRPAPKVGVCPSCGVDFCGRDGPAHMAGGRYCKETAARIHAVQDMEAGAVQETALPAPVRRSSRQVVAVVPQGVGGLIRVSAPSGPLSPVLQSVLARADELSLGAIADAFSNDPRKGKVMVPMAGDSPLCNALQRLIDEELRAPACAIFQSGRAGKAPMDDPFLTLAKVSERDIVAVGSRLAEVRRGAMRFADGAVHLHRDIQPVDVPAGGAIIGAVLFLDDVTEEPRDDAAVIAVGAEEVLVLRPTPQERCPDLPLWCRRRRQMTQRLGKRKAQLLLRGPLLRLLRRADI